MDQKIMQNNNCFLFLIVCFQINYKKQTDDYDLLLNNHYYYFNCKYIKNKQSFLIILKKLINTYNHYNQHLKYIILDHYGINKILQNSLKVILEKSTSTCKIIIVTNHYNNVIHPIKSRCIVLNLETTNMINIFSLKIISLKIIQVLMIIYC